MQRKPVPPRAAPPMDSGHPPHRFTTLGPVGLVKADGNPARSILAQPKRIALLAYLRLAAGGDPVARDAVLRTFWPDLPEERALSSLRQGIRLLRQSLGADAVEDAGDDLLYVPPDRVWCDAAEVERLAGIGRHEEALALYVGPFLDGIPVEGPHALEDWIGRTRAELARRAERSAAELGDAALAREPDLSPSQVTRDEPLVLEPSVPTDPPRRWPPAALLFVALVSLFLALAIALLVVLPRRV